MGGGPEETWLDMLVEPWLDMLVDVDDGGSMLRGRPNSGIGLEDMLSITVQSITERRGGTVVVVLIQNDGVFGVKRKVGVSDLLAKE